MLSLEQLREEEGMEVGSSLGWLGEMESELAGDARYVAKWLRREKSGRASERKGQHLHCS